MQTRLEVADEVLRKKLRAQQSATAKLLQSLSIPFAEHRETYVALLHGATTSASFASYLHPFEKGNILFFTAWPMLAACFALYYLRDLDTIGTIGLAELVLCRGRRPRLQQTSRASQLR